MKFANYLGQPIDVTGHHPISQSLSGRRDQIVPEWRSAPGRSGDYAPDERVAEILKYTLDEADAGTLEFEVQGDVGQASFALLQGPRIQVFDVDFSYEDNNLDEQTLVRLVEVAMNKPDIINDITPFGDSSPSGTAEEAGPSVGEGDDEVPF